MKKLKYNKTAKGIVSLVTIVILLSSILATTIYYDNIITANVIKETSSSKLQIHSITEFAYE